MKNLRFVLMSMLMLVCGSAMAEDIIWQEDWSTVTDFKGNPNDFNSNYTFTGMVLNEDGTVKSGTKFYDANLAGGEAPELLVAKNGGTFTVSPLPLTGHTGEMFLAFKANKKTLTVTVDGAEIGEVTNTGNDYVYPITVAEGQAHISITFTTSSSDNVRLDNIKLYQGDAKKPAGLSWGTSSRTVTIDADDNVFPTLSNDNGLTVTYDSSDKTVATIDATGAITLVAAGTTDISATFEGDDEYEAQTVTYKLTVNAGGGDVPVSTTITVAKALEIIDALEDGKTTTESYQVKGFIVGAPDFQRKADGSLYGNVNLTIADEKEGTALLTVYRGKDLENKNFTEETISRIKEGDEVVFQGQLQKYVKDEVVTPELKNGYLISVNAGETPETVEAPEFNPNGGEFEESIEVTLTCATEGATIYYAVADAPSLEWQEYTAPITLTETTILAAKAKKGDVESDMVRATFTKKEPVVITFEGDGTQANPYTVADVKKMSEADYPKDKVWVKGIIIGTAKSGTALNDVEDVNSNIAIADATSTEFIPVQLSNGSDARAKLNLKDNPDNKGKEVKVFGQITKYFSVNGVKNVEAFEIDGVTTAIQTISASADNVPVYNLAGQRVMKAQKGLFIQNGKKFMVK